VDKISLFNLLGVAVIAFLVPFTLGFFPRLRIPSIVLELLAGYVFGPAVLGWIRPGPVVTIISTIGVAFLLFLAGMEIDLSALRGAPLKLGSIGFILSFTIAVALAIPLGLANVVLTPLLIAIALAATSVGIIIPVLRDTGQLDSPTGRFTVAGATVAEFATIALLGVFYSGAGTSSIIEALRLAVLAVLAVLLLTGLSRAWKWEPGRVVTSRLDDTSSQVRVRFAVMILIGSAVVASQFGFESILGTFLAGAVLAIIIRGDKFEKPFRRKLEAMGFGFFVPAFFITSGMKLDLSSIDSPSAVGRVALLFVMLLLIRGLPALLYRSHLTRRETLAAALLQATNLSFIVVAVTVGEEIGRIRPVTGSALVLAGVLSAVIFPASAQLVLGGRTSPVEAADDEIEERL
jgi:Kef-type K+ transport system membrane component KefB